MDVRIEEGWKRVLSDEFAKEYFAGLVGFVREAYGREKCYPPAGLIFSAFDRTPYENVKVVILGQDPYHEPGQAQGLAFYVPPQMRPPPSLLNIAKELADDIPQQGVAACDMPAVPNLLSWAEQGVLLLNATLTVAAHRAASHQGRGWETFTDAVVRILAEKRDHLVFILWGASAQRKGAFIDASRHCVIRSPHPSPLSAHRGFFGSRPFSRANAYLSAHGIEPIRWHAT